MAIADRRYCTAITADTGANHKSPPKKKKYPPPIPPKKGKGGVLFLQKIPQNLLQ